jgi:hypothetical protein
VTEKRTCKLYGRLSARVKDTGAGLLCGVCQLKEHIDDDDLQGTKCLASEAAGNSQPDDAKSIGSGLDTAVPSERVAACAGSGREPGNQHEGRRAPASPVLLLTDREQADGGDGLRDGERDHAEVRAAAISRGKRRLDLSLEQQRQFKHECPSSIFLGVHPFWSADQLLYGFWVRHLGKDLSYGRFSDENQAALVRDYAARKHIELTHCRQLPMNSDQFFLDDDNIKAKMDEKVAEWVNKMRSTSEARSKYEYGVEITDGVQYRVRLRIGRKNVTFGTSSNGRDGVSCV